MPSIALSVVVPSVNGPADLLGCLDALAAQRDDVPLEVIVVDRCGTEVRDAVRLRFPDVCVTAAPAGTPIPALRRVGIAAAHGDSVAIIEDHVIVPIGWARALLDAQRAGTPVVGGAVENLATERLVDWAAFLCEYSHCIPPLPAGPATWLPGNNVIYPRALLERYRTVLADDAWENRLHETLCRDGVVLTCRPDISVGHKKHFTVLEYLAQRYLYARSHAGARVAGWARTRQVAFGAAAVALPPLLLSRIVARVLTRRRYRADLARSLPLVALFVCAWAVGEVIGAWFGPGDSLSRVR
jgi:glycosyltransferase involved in cell wall biosynthesis